MDTARYAGHGVTLALATAAFALSGHWLDGRLSTAPLFMILGALLGFGGGFYYVIRSVMPEGFGDGRSSRETEGGSEEREPPEEKPHGHDRRTPS